MSGPRPRGRTKGERVRATVRTPDFEAGILAEPLMTFGRQHQHVDPKTGLALYGPYSLKDQVAPALKGFIVGIVGPRNMVADAEQWLGACANKLTNDGNQPFLSPHFPGMREGVPFACTMTYGEAWREVIRDDDLNDALKTDELAQRITKVVQLYSNALETLSTREPKPNVVLCCFPQAVVDSCTLTAAVPRAAPPVKPRPTARERRSAEVGQLDFFAAGADTGSEDADAPPDVFLNLRRGLKASAMQHRLPTQIVWPRTLALVETNTRSPKMRAQDPATRAWNFCTALYHKAGGVPWRPAEFEPGVCFVGLSFFHERTQEALIRTSMAQAYTAAGDGYVLRGASFEWDPTQGRSPHLTSALAASLMRDVVALYKRQNRDALPSRLVVHKTSEFWDEEVTGIKEGLHGVARYDLVALGHRGLQFYRAGDYPVVRGTYVKLSDDDLLLYSSGYVPYLRTYPGARVPQPLQVIQHMGDSPWDRVLRELLALTKLNWNTAAFASSHPITIAFSRRVGEVLAELTPHDEILEDYRFYM